MQSLLTSIEAPFSRFTVSASEKQLAASVLLRCKRFYDENYDYIEALAARIQEGGLDVEGGRPVWSYEIHRVRGDATNAAVAHGQKAHLLGASRSPS